MVVVCILLNFNHVVMKKAIVLFFGLWVTMFYACYEDKGNYDYTEREEIYVDLAPSMTVESGVSVLDFTVNPTPAGEYDYLWLLQKNGVSFNFDTIGREQHLYWEANISEGQYTLYLKVTSQKDGYSRLFPMRIWATSDYSDGWFVLKGIDGMTDLDFHSAASGKIVDIFDRMLGGRMPGMAGDLSLSLGTSWQPEEGEARHGVNMLWACSSEDAWLVDFTEMVKLREWTDMFMDGQKDERPLFNMIWGYRGMLLCTDKNAYFVNNQGPIIGQFGLSFDLGTNGMMPGNSAIQCFDGYYLYDEKNQRFLAATNSGGSVITFDSEREDGQAPPKDVNATGCSMLYMGICKASDKEFYAVMEDGNNRFVYTLSIPRWLFMGPYWNPIERVASVTGKKLNEATIFAIHSTKSYIYYNDASGERVHYYDVKANQEVTDVFHFPGERITFMKALYYDAINANEWDKFDKFVIATEKDGHYKIYLYEMVDGKPDTSNTLQVLEGEGSVSSVQRISKTMNNMISKFLPGNFGISGGNR